MRRLLPYLKKGLIEAGCDEAGRGCLAGPVVAAAVILAPGTRLPGLDDSKKLSAVQRAVLSTQIKERSAAWAIASASPLEIDRINILCASFLAMHRAIDQLQQKPELLLIDGHMFTQHKNIPHSTQIKGDGRFRSIAAASILAKHERDRQMLELHQQHPDFGWDRNKGYPTEEHREVLELLGPTPHHRLSFHVRVKQLSLEV